MRFWNQKIRVEETNWSVILSPLKGELDKKRVSEKISELFGISFEEARELVQNTPIILLDGLSHPIALQIQSVLAGVRAEVNITNDSLMKRRCYRAVWPTPPKLPVIKPTVTETVKPNPSEEPTALHLSEPISPAKPSQPIESFREPFLDLERRYRELESLYETEVREKQEMRQNYERMLKEEAEKNASELRAAIEEWGEQTQSLKEEYQETRSIYEEKILAHEKEIEQLRIPLQELGPLRERAAQLERQNKEFSERLHQLEAKRELLERNLRERSDELGVWREKHHTLAQKVERFESLYEEEKKRREQIEDLRRQTADSLEHTREEIELQTAETKRWQAEFDKLEEDKKHLEEQFSQFSQEQDSELKRLKQINQELTSALEMTQRQARELMLRAEEQQLIEKRTRLASDLSEKESRLRELTMESERLQSEINERQQRLQTVSVEQSELERKVLDMRQAQRYVVEQSKNKEKPGKLKRAGTGRDASSDDMVAPV